MKPNKVKVKRNMQSKSNLMNNGSSHLSQNIAGILILFAAILLAVSMVFTSETGLFGKVVKDLFLGIFGSVGFAIPIGLFYLGWSIIIQDEPHSIKRKIISMLFAAALLSCLLYLIFTPYAYNSEANFIENLSNFYNEGIELYGGGIIGGLFTAPFTLIFGIVGAYIIVIAALVISLISIVDIPLKVILTETGDLVISIKDFILKLLSNINFDRRGKNDPTTTKKKITNLNPAIVKGRQIHKVSVKNEGIPQKEDGVKTEKGTIGESIDVEEEKRRGNSTERVRSLKAEELKLEHNILGDIKEEYKYPSIELLTRGLENEKTGSKRDLKDTAAKLEQTLTSFGVNAKVVNISKGPTVTRYELSPGAGVKVSKIVGLADDLALNLAASAVRIEAPIPGKAAVGIEIPNKEILPVHLRELIETREFKNFPSNLTFAIGKDIAGRIIIADIAKMPHLLIAGATGSGKSVCINTLIASILYKARPDQVKLVMIDPKVVELGMYNGIPHLLIPVVTDPRKAAGALNWAVQEMVSRYNLFAEKGVRDIRGYNTVIGEEGSDAVLPQIVIIIDELADLMMVAPSDVEDAICRLAQMARAAGMHLVVATQRPSVDVITGVIKANIPSRISFAVSSQVDSRTILDSAGAEKLLGKGDMLYYPVGQPKPIRLQGTLISDKEVEAVVEFIKGQAEASYNEDIIEKLESEGTINDADPGDNDVLLPQAADMIIETGQASISIIQRRFKVGYARAARLIDQMEARGIIGGFEGSKPRRVLITKQQWEEMKAE